MRTLANWKRLLVTTALLGVLIPAATASAQTVTVQPGDSLYKLAKRYNLTVAHLKIANHLTGDIIYAGSTLYIPPQSLIHTVSSTDSLWKIAKKYGTTVAKLKEINRLTGDEIWTGSKLLVPVAQSATKPWVEMKTHTVKSGDTPWTISIAYGIPMEEFLKANGLSESDYLYDGQTVKVPVHHIPVTETPGPRYGEYLDWFETAQYLFPINATATVTDFYTGKSFRVKRTIGAGHSDTEPLTASDAAVIRQIWGGAYSWKARPVIVTVNGRRIAASMTSMPHGIEYISNNNFAGHFDIHFLNSLRHNDGKLDPAHQAAVKIAAGRQ